MRRAPCGPEELTTNSILPVRECGHMSHASKLRAFRGFVSQLTSSKQGAMSSTSREDSGIEFPSSAFRRRNKTVIYILRSITSNNPTKQQWKIESTRFYPQSQGVSAAAAAADTGCIRKTRMPSRYQYEAKLATGMPTNWANSVLLYSWPPREYTTNTHSATLIGALSPASWLRGLECRGPGSGLLLLGGRRRPTPGHLRARASEAFVFLSIIPVGHKAATGDSQSHNIKEPKI